VLLIVMVILLFRRLGGAVRLGEVSLVSLMKDYRDGRVGRDYPVGLAEMKDTFEFMLQLASSTQPVRKAATPVAREQDGDVSAETITESLGEINEHVNDNQGQEAGAANAADRGNMVVEENPLIIEDSDTRVDASIFRA
jgi:hypothetical protein